MECWMTNQACHRNLTKGVRLMNIRIETGALEVTLDKHGKRECLTVLDKSGRDEIAFEMGEGATVDILTDIVSLLDIRQLKELAGKIVNEGLDDKMLSAFLQTIETERTEREQEKMNFNFTLSAVLQ